MPAMKSAEYHNLLDALVAQPLRSEGWIQERRRLCRRSGHSVAALLVVGSKFSSLGQFVQYTLCFRHDFLRTLEMIPARGLLTEPDEYPIKIAPSGASQYLRKGRLRGWAYTPVNLGVRDREYDTIPYGELSPEAVERELVILRSVLQEFVPAFQEFFTPEEAVRQLRRNGEGAYCERIWIEDYEAFLDAAE